MTTEEILELIDSELLKIEAELPRFTDIEWATQRLIGQRLMLNYLKRIITGELSPSLRSNKALV